MEKPPVGPSPPTKARVVDQVVDDAVEEIEDDLADGAARQRTLITLGRFDAAVEIRVRHPQAKYAVLSEPISNLYTDGHWTQLAEPEDTARPDEQPGGRAINSPEGRTARPRFLYLPGRCHKLDLSGFARYVVIMASDVCVTNMTRRDTVSTARSIMSLSRVETGHLVDEAYAGVGDQQTRYGCHMTSLAAPAGPAASAEFLRGLGLLTGES